MSKHHSIVTPERFMSGQTFQEYVASASTNGEEFQQGYHSFSLAPDDAAFFAELPARLKGPVYVLLLGEDWCPDVVDNLPIMARLAECSPDIHLRIFPREQNLDIMNLYLKDGQYQSIPTVVWYDKDFNELGFWSERSADAVVLRAEVHAEVEKLGLSPAEMRREVRRRVLGQGKTRLQTATVREIRALLGRVAYP